MSHIIPKGYRFAGHYCGIKQDASKLDLSLIVSDRDAAAAGVFTTNRVCAAPVHSCRRRLPSASIRGIVINSGNANACTGELGMETAEKTTAVLAEKLVCSAEQVLVCSTGVIGRPLPIDRLARGIEAAYPKLATDEHALTAAAKGILTTDTTTKIVSQQVEVGGGIVTVLGIAKGAAMIGPNMATMLAFVLTDAVATPDELRDALCNAVDGSFHCISVEGHTSTNDSVLLLANGASGVAVPSKPGSALHQAITETCQSLAKMIVSDAEGAEHVLVLDVTGARSDAEARQIAKTVADSALVKTAIYGNDPNWGRICSAAGYAGVPFEEYELSLRVNGTLLYDKGSPTQFDADTESVRMRENRETHIELILTLGNGRCRFWSCDLTTEYVRLNADYTT